MVAFKANPKAGAEFAARVRTIRPKRLIFLYESGITTSVARLRARSTGGGRIHDAILGVTGKHHHPRHHESSRRRRQEATDHDIFPAFVQQVLCAARDLAS